MRVITETSGRVSPGGRHRSRLTVGRALWFGALTILGGIAVVIVGLLVAGAILLRSFGELEVGIDPVPPDCPSSGVPLLQAAYAGDVDQMSGLLASGVSPDVTDTDGRTALSCAARGSQPETTARLLAAGADPGIANAAGDTPLLWAAQRGDSATVDALLAGGAAVDQATDAGHTPLLRAVYAGHAEVVERLLAAGADPDLGGGVDSLAMATIVEGVLLGEPRGDDPAIAPAGTGAHGTPADNITPLHAAAAAGRPDLVTLLLGAGADPEAVALDRYTPLHVAAMLGDAEAATVLLWGGADPTPDGPGSTPADLARTRGHAALADMLEASEAAQPAG
jgi:ankyrin repeat protein